MTRRRCERGLVESTQLAVLVPLILLVVFSVIQASIWFAGRSAVQQAAMAGAEHAAFADAGPDAAVGVAQQVAADSGLLDVRVQVGFTGTTVDVTVDARVPSVLPGRWSLVSATAHRMREA